VDVSFSLGNIGVNVLCQGFAKLSEAGLGSRASLQFILFIFNMQVYTGRVYHFQQPSASREFQQNSLAMNPTETAVENTSGRFEHRPIYEKTGRKKQVYPLRQVESSALFHDALEGSQSLFHFFSQIIIEQVP